jgi:biofilm PGA synthesis N-glycosyltransferase PgaC
LERILCSVGVTAYNEQANIGKLLQALLDQELDRVGITEIVVVASACTDDTIPIVQSFVQRDPRVRLIVQEKREGKP